MKKRILFWGACLIATLSAAQHTTVSVLLDTSIKTNLRGRLYIFTSTDTSRGVQDPDPFNPTPTFVQDVADWQPGVSKVLDSATAAWPLPLHRLKPGYYKFAAVLDIDTEERNNTVTPGNLYSRDVVVQVKPGESFQVKLTLNRTIPRRPFKETPRIKLAELKSRLVSAFRKKDSYIRAAVVLPASYQSGSGNRYPVVFVIPGWGGTHYDVFSPAISARYGFDMGREKIFVYLNPETSNPYGLHAFIDSRVNGPWGKALVSELIPWLQEKYALSGDYFVAGQSSGGYAALWLQLHYPDTFSGCWAVSPDPVDFSDFTGINLYENGANMYFDKDGRERGMFRLNGKYVGTIRSYAGFETFLGDGGQMQSFEAAFGIPDKMSGRPQRLFDRVTGTINPKVVKTWKPYDLGIVFERNYPKRKNVLVNKVNVFAGADDNFLLNKSVEKLQARIRRLDAAATADIIPGANHWTIWNEIFTQKMHETFDRLIRVK